ncbi:small integral membrane protein 14 isoform X2 [Phycodurus eques]|nr:small integral membrane protein 14 isoform X2 [Phycodurus eques]
MAEGGFDPCECICSHEYAMRRLINLVPILIPAASHSAANRSSESWRSRLDEANRTTSSAKSRDAILRPPNWNPSMPRLRLEILSVEVFKIFSPPTHNVPSRSQQLPIPTIPLLRRRMVDRNFLEAVRKSFSMASPNSSHARVFASATTKAAFRSASRYPSAASGVPQAKKPDRAPSA